MGGSLIGWGLLAVVALVGWVAVACGGDGGSDTAVETDGTDAGGSQGAEADDPDGSQPDGPDSGSPRDLIGRTFVAESVTEDGEKRPLVDGTEIEVGFPEEGRLSASAGCNGLGAPVTVDHGRITLVEDLERTLKLCEPQELMDQEKWLAGFLRAGPSYALEGTRLTLETGEARMELVAARAGSDTTGPPPDGVDTGASTAAEAPSGKNELPGTTWQVTELIDGNTLALRHPKARL